MKKRIIFDIDGTLLESQDFRNSVVMAFERNGIVYKEEDLKRFLDGMSSYEDVNRRYNIRDYYEYLRCFSGLDIDMNFIRDYLHNAELLVDKPASDDVLETLDYLKLKYDLVVLTNFFREVQQERLRVAGLDRYFSEVYGGENYIKPSRDAFALAISSYNAYDCVMVGDDYVRDFKGATAAGVSAIYYNKTGKVNMVDEINDFKYLRKIL